METSVMGLYEREFTDFEHLLIIRYNRGDLSSSEVTRICRTRPHLANFLALSESEFSHED